MHWHRLGMWLPAGGHIEPDEDPLQAVLREVLEETTIEAEVMPTAPASPHRHPPQLPPPVTIGVYDIDEPGNPHQHIDFVYFTRPRTAPTGPASSGADAPPPLPSDPAQAWRWVGSAELAAGATLAPPAGTQGPAITIAEDVRLLALEAIRHATDTSTP